MARRLRDNEKKQTHKLEGISWGINLSQYDSVRGTCVYKLFYGKKFIIHKGKTLSGSLFILEKNYKYFVAYNHQSNDKDVDYYYKFYDYIRKHEGLEFKIEPSEISSSLNKYKTLPGRMNILSGRHKTFESWCFLVHP
jgi:hypothetical protein